MKRLFASLLVLGLATVSAQAHFIWIAPDRNGGSARIVFSDTFSPDDPKLLDKIVKTQVSLRRADFSETPLKWTRGKDAFDVFVPGKGPRAVCGVCRYGVVQKGDADPFQLIYYAKAIVGADASSKQAATGWKFMTLDILPAAGKFQVLFQGKPAAGVEVTCSLPGSEKAEKRTTDKDGTFELGSGIAGTCGIMARYVEPVQGELDGKKYKEIRHYATLVIQIAEGTKQAGTPKSDPLATKLLADARAARAQWVKFPGFSADAEVNIDGKISTGKVRVEPTGKVHFEKLDSDAEAWAKRQLSSVVAHRIDDSASLDTPCAFTDGDAANPLGRAIRVLNDELHSSYRVRDQQIIVVNRQMPTARFSITVLENRKNKEGKYLPASYVVHYWDTKTGDLQKTEAHSHTWTRMDGFDLPVTAYVITATKDLSSRRLKLSNHSLSK
jgi:Protein of unknown function (DUF3386)/Domain of unknown function (DUF4198)